VAIELDTAEIQIETVGVEAAQQVLQALTGSTAEMSTTTADVPTPAPGGPQVVQAASPEHNAVQPDNTALLAAIERTNAILAEILAALEARPVQQQPTY